MPHRALVVEDDTSTQNLLREILESEEMLVDVAGDGDVAIDLLGRHTYSAILMDIVLPTVSGTAVMEHLREVNPAALQRVIVISGLDIAEIQKLFPTVGQAMMKPVLPTRLRTLLRNWLEPPPSGCPSMA